MAYRYDAGALARERIRLRARLRELEGRFTEVFWAEVAPLLGLGRGPLRLAGVGGERDEIALLALRVGAIESVVARFRLIERSWCRPAPTAPRGPGSSALGGDGETLETALARDRLAEWLAPARIPLDVRVRPRRHGVTWGLATSAPRGAGRLIVEPERLLDDLRKMAGVLHDIDCGDDEFDGVFLVRGHEPTARAVLDEETRRRLLRVGARSARLRAELGEGAAVIEVEGAPDRRLVEDVLALLRRLRCAPVRPLCAREPDAPPDAAPGNATIATAGRSGRR